MHCRNRTTLISHQQRRPWLANGMLDVWLHGIPLFRSVTTVVSACQGLHGLYRKPSTEATRKYLSTSSKAGYSNARVHMLSATFLEILTRSYSTCAEMVPVIQSLVAPASQCFVSGCHSPVVPPAPYHFRRRSSKAQESRKQTTWRSR